MTRRRPAQHWHVLNTILRALKCHVSGIPNESCKRMCYHQTVFTAWSIWIVIKAYAKHVFRDVWLGSTFVRQPSCSLGTSLRLTFSFSSFIPGLRCNTGENQLCHVHPAGLPRCCLLPTTMSPQNVNTTNYMSFYASLWQDKLLAFFWGTIQGFAIWDFSILSTILIFWMLMLVTLPPWLHPVLPA